MPRILAVLATLICLMCICPAASAEDAKEVASEHFDKGIMLFKNQDYSAALIEFEAAYDAHPHFAVRYNIAICLWKTKKYGDAADQIQRYLSEGGEEIPKAKKKEVEEIYKELESLVASLKVESNVEGAEIYINGKRRDKTPMFFPLKLDVGEYEVEVKAEGHEPFKTTVKLPGGANKVIEAKLVAVGKAKPEKVEPKKVDKGEPKKKKVPVAAFASVAGLAVALAVTASITGGVALKKSRDYRDAPYEEGWEDEQKSGRKLAIATDVLWGITGAAAATTIVLIFFTDFKAKEKKSEVALYPMLTEPGLLIMGHF